MKRTVILSWVALAVCPLMVSSCTALGVGAGAVAGVAASKEGGLSRALSDTRIQAEINDLWFKYSTEAFGKLDMTVNNGRVLLTGVVQNPDQRVEAVRLAWQPKGVEQVINEIRVAESEGIKGYARDSWITTRLRAALVFDKEIASLNYSIDTVQGTVYLMATPTVKVNWIKLFKRHGQSLMLNRSLATSKSLSWLTVKCRSLRRLSPMTQRQTQTQSKAGQCCQSKMRCFS